MTDKTRYTISLSRAQLGIIMEALVIAQQHASQHKFDDEEAALCFHDLSRIRDGEEPIRVEPYWPQVPPTMPPWPNQWPIISNSGRATSHTREDIP